MALLSHGRDINFIIKKVKFWIRNYAKYSITKSRLYYVVYRNENHTSKISPKQNKNKQNTWHLLQPSPTHPRTHTRTHAAHSTAPLASAGPDSPPDLIASSRDSPPMRRGGHAEALLLRRRRGPARLWVAVLALLAGTLWLLSSSSSAGLGLGLARSSYGLQVRVRASCFPLLRVNNNNTPSRCDGCAVRSILGTPSNGARFEDEDILRALF